MRAAWLPLFLLSSACIDDVIQVAGTGASYTTRCSAVMDVRGDEYSANCTPNLCQTNYQEAALNQVVVAVDPGRKVVGYAERVCLQDLSQATALFQPAADSTAETTVTPQE